MVTTTAAEQTAAEKEADTPPANTAEAVKVEGESKSSVDSKEVIAPPAAAQPAEPPKKHSRILSNTNIDSALSTLSKMQEPKLPVIKSSVDDGNNTTNATKKKLSPSKETGEDDDDDDKTAVKSTIATTPEIRMTPSNSRTMMKRSLSGEFSFDGDLTIPATPLQIAKTLVTTPPHTSIIDDDIHNKIHDEEMDDYSINNSNINSSANNDNVNNNNNKASSLSQNVPNTTLASAASASTLMSIASTSVSISASTSGASRSSSPMPSSSNHNNNNQQQQQPHSSIPFIPPVESLRDKKDSNSNFMTTIQALDKTISDGMLLGSNNAAAAAAAAAAAPTSEHHSIKIIDKNETTGIAIMNAKVDNSNDDTDEKKQMKEKKDKFNRPVTIENDTDDDTTTGTDNPEDNNNMIRLGICAMDKKARSKPMAEILSRLDDSIFQVVFFGDEMILKRDIEEWPTCHALIAFFSKNYPLEKVQAYVELRKPFILNDLKTQETLKDRRKVYDLLEASGIDVPRHVYLSHDDYVSTGSGDGNGARDSEVTEYDDHIEVNGVSIVKPFVEKPIDADDHDIAIYYPTSAGGGCKKLFRKIGNRSSEFYPGINEVRRDGSYIYEEFVETQGTDVKMYTVGPEYGHAEARKSPTVDGKVERNSEGKEVRFPVILTYREKEIARRVVLTFKQFVCGFDLLRVQEDPGHSFVSYVCDVNGWSFVKNSRKYYDDCAQIITEHILAALRPAALTGFSTLNPLVIQNTCAFPSDEQQQQHHHQEGGVDGTPTRNNTKLLDGGEGKENTGSDRSANSAKNAITKTISRATRILQRELAGETKNNDDNNTDDLMNKNNESQLQQNSPPRSTTSSAHDGAVGDGITSATASESGSAVTGGGGGGANSSIGSGATLVSEGAVPIRKMENYLTSEPAAICPSSNNSSDNEQMYKKRRSNSFTLSSSTKSQGGYNRFGGSMMSSSSTASLANATKEELRCVIAVIRHGDRTPKQKQKLKIKEPKILKFFHKYAKSGCKKEIKVKGKKPLTHFLETVKIILDDYESAVIDPNKKKPDKNLLHQLRHMRDVLERWKIVGLNRKLQIKPLDWEDYEDPTTGKTKQRCTKVQLVLKWGGNLTKLGEKQSINLGQRLRHEMYPDAPGGGILRLHSTFRHDLKIKTSDEGRVMKTAAAFAKGLLELEGDLPPILVSLVHKEHGSMHMLDPSGNKEVKEELEICKEKITANLQRDINSNKATEEELEQLVGPKILTSMYDALYEVDNPRKSLFKIYNLMGDLIGQLEDMLDRMASGDEKHIEGGEGLEGDHEDDVALSGVKLYKGETLLELTERWRFIYDRLYDVETDKFDLSRIPDVHDNVRFDVLHNPHLGLSNTLETLYNLAKSMADCVVPQEYGTTVDEKRSVGVKISKALMEKIKFDFVTAREDDKVDMRYMINMDYSADIHVNSLGRRIRTRLYFTSESHLHTLLNVLCYPPPNSFPSISSVLSERGLQIIHSARELCYLTQIILRLFENSQFDIDDPRRFRVEILFSPGATATPYHMHEMDREHDSTRFDTAGLQMIGKEDLTCKELEDYFDAAIKEGANAEDEKTDDDNDDVEVSNGDKKVNEQPKKMSRDESPLKADASNSKSKDPDVRQAENAQIQPPVEPRGVAASGTTAKEISQLVSPGANAVEHRDSSDSNIEQKIIGKDGVLLVGETNDDLPNVCTENSNTSIENEESGDIGNQGSKEKTNRKIFWTSVAAGSFALATGCIVFALSIGIGESSRQRRRYTTRRL